VDFIKQFNVLLLKNNWLSNIKNKNKNRPPHLHFKKTSDEKPGIFLLGLRENSLELTEV
jgi:hypothetical protein